MAELRDRLQADLQGAMKAREEVRLSALRMLATSVRVREVEVGHDLSDDEVREVAAREVKRRREAAEAYEKAGRGELREREVAEERVLEAYAPERLTDAEVAALVEEAIGATEASGAGDLGKVMGYVMGKAKGRVEGAEVSRLARERLGG